MNMLVVRLAEVNLPPDPEISGGSKVSRSGDGYGAGGAAPSRGSENFMGIPKFEPPKPFSTA